jgi:hypothetical protein
MSWYDEYDKDNPLLMQPKPFWQQDEEAPAVATEPVPVAAPPAPEGGWQSPADIPDEDLQPVAPELPPEPVAVAGGWQSPADIPDEDLKPVEGGWQSPTEIPDEELRPVGWKDELAAVPDQLADYWDKVKNRWAVGREQAVDDQLGYKALSGEAKWEDIKDQLEPSIQPQKGEHWYSEGPLQAVEMLPAMLNSLKESAGQAAKWAGAAMGAAAVGGQLGPQAATPEELFTVPGAGIAGYGAGQVYGGFEYWRRQGSGSLYHDLRKEGIDHETAKNAALAFGIPYAGIELLQVTKLVPGMKESAAHAIAGGIKKRLAAFGKEKVAEYGEQIYQEVSQELMQAGSEAVAEWQAGVEAPAEKRGIVERAWDTIKQTAISVPFLMGPKAAVDVARIATVPGEVPVAAPPGVLPPEAAATVPPEAAVPGIMPEAAVPSVVPGAVPGVTIAPAPGEVPVPPDLAGAPAVTPPGAPLTELAGTPPTATAPAVVPPVVPAPPLSASAAGKTVVSVAQRQNEKVQEVADTQTQNLQAAGAPETAKAIQQVAQQAKTEASVTAAEFLDQALAQQAVDNVTGVPPVAPVEAPGAVQPGEFVQPGYTATAPAAPDLTAPAATPAPAAAAAAPAVTAPAAGAPAVTPAVVVGGQVFTGDTHAQAAFNAHQAVGPDAMGSAETGWVDPESGRFATHEIYDAHRAWNAALDAAGGDTNHPSVAAAGAQFAEAQARDEEIQGQIVQPGGEQVVQPGIKGNEAVVTPRPSQALAVPLAGVTVQVEGVDAQGQSVTAERPAAQALNDAKNDHTGLTILLDCLH